MTDLEYEELAIILIRQYVNKDTLTDDDIKNNYPLVVRRVSDRIKELDDIPNGISTIKKGDESITYLTKNIMTKDITEFLPRPYLKYL